MRAMEKPYWLAHQQHDCTSTGMWLFGRYADAVDIFRLTRTLSKQITRVRSSDRYSPMDFHLLNQDPPRHTLLRNLIGYAFTPARVKNLEPWMENIAGELISD